MFKDCGCVNDKKEKEEITNRTICGDQNSPLPSKIERKIFLNCTFKNLKSAFFLSEAEFRDCRFINCDIKCVANEISIRRCVFEETSIRRSSIKNINVEYCEMRSVLLTKTMIEYGSFSDNSFSALRSFKSFFSLSDFSCNVFRDFRFEYLTFYTSSFCENELEEGSRNFALNNFFDEKTSFYKEDYKNVKKKYNPNRTNVVMGIFYECLNKDHLGITNPCPEEGSFIGYKMCWYRNKNTVTKCIVTLEIGEDAKRFGQMSSGKCRCEFAKVLKAETMDGEAIDTQKDKVFSCLDEDFCYNVGEVVFPNQFDEDEEVECGAGIHFFMTKKEAKEYYN